MIVVKTFIIDDEAPAREELHYLLQQIEGVSIVGEAGSGSTALAGIRETSPDLLFLDIHMPGISGLELAKILAELPTHPLVVFATAFDHYACDAFDVEAVDYLVKPFTMERVARAVSKATRLLEGRSASGDFTPAGKIPLYQGERIIPTAPERIVFAQADDGAVYVHTATGRYRSRSILTDLEHKLARHGFVRVHRSFLVNSNHVLEAIPWFNGSFKLIMDDQGRTEIMVSRYHAKDLKKCLDI